MINKGADVLNDLFPDALPYHKDWPCMEDMSDNGQADSQPLETDGVPLGIGWIGESPTTVQDDVDSVMEERMVKEGVRVLSAPVIAPEGNPGQWAEPEPGPRTEPEPGPRTEPEPGQGAQDMVNLVNRVPCASTDKTVPTDMQWPSSIRTISEDGATLLSFEESPQSRTRQQSSALQDSDCASQRVSKVRNHKAAELAPSKHRSRPSKHRSRPSKQRSRPSTPVGIRKRTKALPKTKLLCANATKADRKVASADLRPLHQEVASQMDLASIEKVVDCIRELVKQIWGQGKKYKYLHRFLIVMLVAACHRLQPYYSLFSSMVRFCNSTKEEITDTDIAEVLEGKKKPGEVLEFFCFERKKTQLFAKMWSKYKKPQGEGEGKFETVTAAFRACIDKYNENPAAEHYFRPLVVDKRRKPKLLYRFSSQGVENIVCAWDYFSKADKHSQPAG